MARSKSRLAETEAVGKDLESRTQAASESEEHDKKPTEPDYRAIYQAVQAGEITRADAAREFGITSKGGIYRFSQKLAEIGASPQAEVEVSESAITSTRLTEILKNGHLTELNPRNLLSGPEPRRYQLRRFRSQVHIKELAQSIGKINVIEPLVVRDSLPARLIIDGFGRADAWIMADQAAGGTNEAHVLEYPACLLVDCTDKEAAFIAFEKNRRRENFDEADRDHSIVVLHEQQHYTVNELAALIELDQSSISRIIHAFQDIPTKARTALEDRMITTYHATQLAKLKEWPGEQDRLTSWLLEETGKPEFKSRKDANYENGLRDTMGISAGRLSEMVGDVLERKKQAKAIAADLEKMKSAGKLEDTIDGDKADKLRSQFSKSLHLANSGSITKRTMQEAMKTAGVKLAKPVEAATETGAKPKSPARFAEDREQPKLKPCENCQVYHEKSQKCLFDLTPDKENKCGAQQPGHPTRILSECSICHGATVDAVMVELDVDLTTEWNSFFDCDSHVICIIDQVVSSGALDGKCRSCQNGNCQILDTMRNEFETTEPNGSPLKLFVKECPEGDWFKPRPELSLEEINKRAREYVEELKAEALKESASGGTQ